MTAGVLEPSTSRLRLSPSSLLLLVGLLTCVPKGTTSGSAWLVSKKKNRKEGKSLPEDEPSPFLGSTEWNKAAFSYR
jgi:hypothetical protein